jgi:hypothetical protein
MNIDLQRIMARQAELIRSLDERETHHLAIYLAPDYYEEPAREDALRELVKSDRGRELAEVMLELTRLCQIATESKH